jgi:hypothetical protein
VTESLQDLRSVKPRVCPHCGSDTYFADNFERVRDRMHRLEKERERTAREHAVVVAKLELALFDKEDEHRWLQAKVKKQKRVIGQMAARLAAVGRKPYEADTEA